MNIVYKFTSKITGKFYIGSKTECSVLDGVIYDRSGKAYFTSSQTEDLLDEFAKDNMVLEVLEKCPNRDNLLEREAYYQRLDYVVENPLSYNLIYADLKDKDGYGVRYGKSFDKSSHEGFGNIFKETIKEITWKNRAIGRKDTKSQQHGFDNYGEMYKVMLELKDSGLSYADIDRKLSIPNFSARTVGNLSSEDYNVDVNIPQVKDLLVKGKTLQKICEDLGYKDYVVRYLLGGRDMKTLITLEDKIAVNNGFIDREDLDKYVMRSYLLGKSFNEIAKTLENISRSTCQRIVERIVRERLNVNDFE